MEQKQKSIAENVKDIMNSIPPNVNILAAAKTRTLNEVKEVIQAGVINIGYNYVQEAIPIIESVGVNAKWHMIGHLQRNKCKKAAYYFDMIETIDSWDLAQLLDRYCKELQKTMPVLIEINSGRESNKTGVLIEKVDALIDEMMELENIHIEGVMTMGPRFGNPEDARPYFRITREVFERIGSRNLPKINMNILSMGMSNSYQVAIEEGANLVRIGTKIFGGR